MPISFHDDAKKRFDEVAEEVLSFAKPGQVPQRRAASPPTPDERDMLTLTDKDIDPDSIEISLVTVDGQRSGLYFMVGQTGYALEGEGIEGFERLLGLLCRQRRLAEAVGPKLLSDGIRDWLKARLGGGPAPPFSGWLLERVNASLQRRTVVIPLENVRSQSPFDFAGVRFDPTVITRAMFDEVERRRIAAQPEEEVDIRHAHRRYRGWFQGQMCGVVSVEADPRWAVRSAGERVERALSALRLYSPSAFAPGFKCAVGRVGRVFIPADVACEMVDGLPSMVAEGWAEGYEQLQWPISDKDRAVFMAAGLGDFERLLLKEDPTELEEAVLRAVELLDESVRCNALHKRAALALTAAESLFLQDDSEPIQVMLGLRCGHLVGRNAAERLAIDRTIKSAYELRSGYLHHGRARMDADVLRQLHIVLLDALVAVSRLPPSVRIRPDLFAHLQSLIWA